MKIRLASDNFFASFKTLFPKDDIRVFSKDRDAGESIDLLLFPGGEDVSLNLYADPDTIKTFEELVSSSVERDALEQRVFLDVTKNSRFEKNRINVNKILGVCRGLQFLNVMMFGTLYPDLTYFNKEHGGVHKLSHTIKHPLSFMSFVNSFHHQAVQSVGRYNRFTDDGTRPYILATEPTTSIPEIVVWGDKMLGVQFHPEFYSDENPDKKKFADVITDWVKGRVSFQ